MNSSRHKNQVIDLGKHYAGSCACCFELISHGDEVQIRKGGRMFHKKCIEAHPDNYYVKLERRNLARYGDKEPQQQLSEKGGSTDATNDMGLAGGSPPV